MPKSSRSGRKIGTKMMMISVHSSGQPSRKMSAWVRIRNIVGDRLSERKNCSTTACPPRRANTDENRSEEHTSELQSRQYLVCRLLLEKKNRELLRILLPFLC